MLITWIGLFMLYITKEHKINKEVNKIFNLNSLHLMNYKYYAVNY